jgi:hypothetical protein
MENKYTEEQKYLRAKKKVENLKGFYSNLLAYCLVIPFLIFINLMTSRDHYWFWYPAIGWGIGIVFHAVGVFNHTSFFGRDWEERKIKKMMKDDENRYQNY